MIIRGSLDYVETDVASGWAHSHGAKRPFVVQAMLDTEIIGEAVADLHRPDLEAAGIGDGNCGFLVKFRRNIDPAYLPFVVVTPDNCDLELPRRHPLGFSEFFTSVYRGRSADGRHRSIFGGLWTDRFNAAAMLRGKTAVGQVDKQGAAVVGALIRDGIAVVEEAGSWRGEKVTAKALGGLLTPDFVRALELVLEDRPAVLRVDILTGPSQLSQASTEADVAGQNEAVFVVAPIDARRVQIDTVRGSHELPEFSRAGRSRWVDAQATAAALDDLQPQGFVDQYAVPAGAAAIIGPGLLHAAQGPGAVRLLVVPERAVPFCVLEDVARKEARINDVVRAWL